MKRKRIVLSRFRKRTIRMMNFALLFTLLTSSRVFALTYSEEAMISVKATNEPIANVFKQIEAQSEFLFFYNEEDVSRDAKVSVDKQNCQVEEVLNVLSAQAGFNYRIKDRHIVLTAAKRTKDSPAPKVLQDQTKRRATGTVLDINGEAIIGANIVERGTTNGSITDIDGHFSLNVSDNATLVVTYVGFMDAEIKVGTQTNLEIVIKENPKILDEVVVVGFGVQKRANLTAAVATVDAEQLANRPVANVTQALQGVSPGLNITTSSGGGALNATPNIDIRGTGTIGQGSSSSPLILIDGIEGDINLLNPQDIDNISILKDAGSSAIYGSRAAFGVILVTTKKGKEGKAVVNYNNSFRWSTPTNLPKFLNGYEFNTYFNEAASNAGLAAVYSDEVMEKAKQFMEGKLDFATEYDANGIWKCNMDSWGNTEWFDVYYKDWSFSHEHNLSLSGGTDKVNYYISGNFQNLGSDQNYGDEDYKRYTFNAKINAKPYKWLDVNTNIKFSRKDYEVPYYQTNSVYYHSMPRRRPSNPIKTPDGIFAKESQLNELDHGGQYTDDTDKLYGQLQFVFKPIKNLEIIAEGNVRFDRADIHKEVFLLLERKEDGSYFAMARDDGYGGRSFIQEET